MSLIESAQFNSKVIKRIKIKTRTTTNPEQHLLKTASNIKKGIVQPLASERKHKIFIATAFSQNNQNQSFNQNTQEDYDRINSIIPKIQSSVKDKITPILEKQSKAKKIFQSSAQNEKTQLKMSPKLLKQISQRCDSNENKKERNRIVHMNYRQYEQIINEDELSPTYFQNIAKRNDQILVKKDKAQKDISSIEIKETNKSVTNALPKVMKRKRVKTTIQSLQPNNSMKTIIGCHLGALSNIQIRQKLEEKWINEQRQVIKNNRTMVFTQESEIVSQVDTRQPTHRQHFSLKNRISKKDKKEKTVKQRQIDWDKIENDKFKRALKRILQIKPLKDKEGEVFIGYSCGEEYSERQQILLLARQKLYKPKQLVLKHKLQWER